MPSLATSAPHADAVADFQVSVDGQKLSTQASTAITHVSVDQRLSQASALTLRITAWDNDGSKLAWVDDDLYKPGREIKLEMGTAGDRTPVFQGQIVRLSFELDAAHAELVVEAYDYLFHLGRGQSSRTFRDVSYGDIVDKIAKEHHLSSDTEAGDSDPTHDVVVQENVSDLQFLLGLADEIGYELLADGKKLVFRKSHAEDSPSVTLDSGMGLIDFSGQLAAGDQLGSVEVHAFDTVGKQKITASESNPRGSTDDAFDAASVVIIDQAVTKQEQASARARAELLRMRLGYLDATASCFGRTDVQVGTVVELSNLGKRFGGRYYVTGALHSLSAGLFRTRLALKGLPR